MKCVKCGKEIPEGEKKICDDCQKTLLSDLENDVVAEAVKENEAIGKVEKDKKNEQDEKKIEIKENAHKDNDMQQEKSVKKDKKVKMVIPIIILIIIALLILVKLFFADGISISNFVNNKVGNSIANIRNYGYAAEQKGMVYFVAPTKDGKEIAIYKTKKSKVDPKELVKGNWDVLGLNVVNNYIYFIAITDEAIEKSATLSADEVALDTLNNKIYRMKTDGTDLEVINSNEFHNNCYEIYVIDDKIYYIGVDTNIWSMNLDGSEKTKINDDKTGFLGLTKDYIILNVEKKQKETETETEDKKAEEATVYETCIMNIDGTNKKVLNGQRLYSINVVNDYIYYVDDEKVVYKIKIDGTDNVKISDKIKAYNMNIINDRIFFMNYVDNTQKIAIYSMALDGSDIKEVIQLENYSSFLNTIDNNIIFMDSNQDSASINMVNLDGTEKKVLYELKQQSTVEEKNNEVVENTTATTETPAVEEKATAEEKTEVAQ
ncbi:MAG: DUF5050 domain-containing protein [Clostridia bacterium]|nr:DUF5050 domain-containing protein [Clostridia bacterium]